jgi:hypothetical protein
MWCLQLSFDPHRQIDIQYINAPHSYFQTLHSNNRDPSPLLPSHKHNISPRCTIAKNPFHKHIQIYFTEWLQHSMSLLVQPRLSDSLPALNKPAVSQSHNVSAKQHAVSNPIHLSDIPLPSNQQRQTGADSSGKSVIPLCCKCHTPTQLSPNTK